MLRLDKYLSNHAGVSRSEARAYIKNGIVTVNGDIIRSIGQKVALEDDIFMLNQQVSISGETYILLYKPAGVICTTDEEEKCDTVMDMVPDYDDMGLLMAGRLDKDTTGVVLLSTDGKWTHKVTSPNYLCEKVYELETADPIDEDLVSHFERGVLLKDNPKPTDPAKLVILDTHKARLTLTEGRYHQIKRMFGACGNKVTSLHRSAVGIVNLVGLEEGGCRKLTKEEIDSFASKA